jgi:hypothetical protein
LRYAVLALFALWMTSCTTLTANSSPEEKEKIVATRAEARWQAIISKDFDTAYGYLSPASRATVTRAGFKTVASRLAYRAAKVTRVNCDATVCKVAIDLTYDAPTMKGVRTPLQESWIIDKGQAWFVWGA